MPASEHAESPGSSDVLATSRSLLARARSRDDRAWEKLVELYAPLVYFWCRRSHVPQQDIADVVQDVFRAVVSGIDAFKKERASDTFRGWLRTVTRSKISDHFRRQRRTPLPGGSDLSPAAPADDADEEFDEETAERALFFRGLDVIRDQFEPHVWEAFWRVVVEDQSVADVAQALGMRPGTVRVAKCRVLQRLRQELGDVE